MIYTCQRGDCGSPNVEVIERHNDADKPIGIRCRDCRSYTFPPKPGNENRRRDHNARWRKDWRTQLGGELTCTWCRVRESETRCSFHIDHVTPLEAGGADEFANTMPLCRNCHTKRHADQAVVQHLQGRSAREHPEAA
jgi:hypothetical protein